MGNISETIIALESAALERWNAGDPDGYLELYDQDVTYFDPAQEQRLGGLGKMTGYYEMARGKSTVSAYSMIAPLVQQTGESSAVLSYNLSQITPERSYLWHCTQVYKKRVDGEWKIAHNHWSPINTL